MIRLTFDLNKLLLLIEVVVLVFYQINQRAQEDQIIIDFIVDSRLIILLGKALLKINKDLIVVLYPLVIPIADKPQAEIFKTNKLQADKNLQNSIRTNLIILILHLVINLLKI